MAVEHSYVAQSLDGGVYWRAPLGTTLPTAPVESPEDLNAAFEDHGTAAVDGLSVGITRTSNTVKDFDGGDYVDVQTEYGTSFKIKLLDVDLPSVKRTVAGDDNVTLIPAAGGKGQRYHVRHNSSQLPLSATCSPRSAARSSRRTSWRRAASRRSRSGRTSRRTRRRGVDDPSVPQLQRRLRRRVRRRGRHRRHFG
ncbi:hypothetical protein [Gordonia westfalica]|uniref:hypothetical protein n=1 Tax=Gordonia westfalica TaxID=158898 RepID=UPI000A82A79F|nr:hypothetical protein [Gordonia westfalica]